MTELPKLLEESGIRKAVVIDDVFDAVPRPDDLADGDWSTFFDDLGEDGAKLLAESYPGYEDAALEGLRNSQKFISVVWENRKDLPPAACDPLFSEYVTTNATERTELEGLVARLESLGLTCTTTGRDPNEEAKEADLIIVDLFLGYQQSEDYIDRAVRRAKELVEERIQNPPLVVLMSRSPLLQDKRNDFRDNAGLLGSAFRVISKADLAVSGKLETLLRRLAVHYEDAKRVAGFVNAWNTGLDQARKNFIQTLRRLDLPDLAQIWALLLDFEGQMLGEYLLDVADRVLQHEIESDSRTIEAALELNNIDLDKYPAPHLVGSPDLQDLMHRMIFLHSDRLRLSKKEDKIQLQFGDVLRWKSEDGMAFRDDISLVVTPACDLARDGVERVMLLSGKLESLEPKNWSYKANPVRTPIVILPDKDRKWIRWDLKNIRALSWNELDNLFGGPERLVRVGRLREIYTIEIQQKMIADLGRVGRPANLPVSFPVNVSLFYVGTDFKAQKLDVEEIESAACYVGRDADSKPVHRLVLTEQECDHIEIALQSLADDAVHDSAQASLSAVKKDQGFSTRFERGEIEIPQEGGTKFIRAADKKVYAAVVREESFGEGSEIKSERRKACLIVKVADMLEDNPN